MSDRVNKHEYDTCKECGRVERCEDLNRNICEHCWRDMEEKIRQAKGRAM